MKILKQVNLDNVLFIDIETVSQVKDLQPNTPLWEAWNYKMKFGREPIGGEDAAGTYKAQASLYAEFGKIVCITIGKIKDDVLKLKSYTSHDEKELLTNFCNALNNMTASNKHLVLCGQAIKGFDIPWMMRRCLVHQIELPNLLDTGHLKPWELTAIDTMELWKGSGFNGGSLIAMAVAIGLHNPKDEIAGYQTSEVYYSNEDALNIIQRYCEKDVLTVANIIRKFRYEPIVEAESSNIEVKKVGLLERINNTKVISQEDQKNILNKFSQLGEAEKAMANEIIVAAIPTPKEKRVKKVK